MEESGCRAGGASKPAPAVPGNGADRKAQELQFYKNLGLVGGLVLAATARR